MSRRRHQGRRRRAQRRQETLEALSNFRSDTAIHGRRVVVLKRYADIVLPSADVGYQQARADAGLSRNAWWKPIAGVACFACEERRAVHAHHVIQLQHGGADMPENKVPLCEGCHAYIHDWMPVKSAPIDNRDAPFWSGHISQK